jgi:LytS/YehU family sensor histidine kinase
MFSDMLRYVLHTEKSGLEHVPLQQELDFTRDYLALEALRLGPRLTVNWQLDDALLAVPVPALCVQPLVENSIKHAFSTRSAPGQLTIKLSQLQKPKRLCLEVADDGPGCAPQALDSGGGLGLKTVSRRLVLQYGEAAALQVNSQPGAGFSVSFVLPLDD